VQTTTATVPQGLLATSTTYYARVRAVSGAIQAISERILFVTEELPVPVPVLITPADGSEIFGTSIEILWQQQDSKGFRAELSTDASFPTRNTKLKSMDAFIYSAIFEDLTPDTYYLRVRAKNSKGLTEPSAYVTVYLRGPDATISDINVGESCYAYYDVAGNCRIVINNATASSASVYIYSVAGVPLSKQTYSLDAGENILSPDMTGYAQGIYLIKVKIGNIEKTMKVRK
jgi:hypothetical protein